MTTANTVQPGDQIVLEKFGVRYVREANTKDGKTILLLAGEQDIVLLPASMTVEVYR